MSWRRVPLLRLSSPDFSFQLRQSLKEKEEEEKEEEEKEKEEKEKEE